MQLSDPINNIVLVPIYVRYSTFISTLLGYINGFPGTSFNDKIPLPSPEKCEERLHSVHAPALGQD